MRSMQTISVNLGDRSYPVVIGHGVARQLPVRLRRIIAPGRLFVIYDAQVYALYGARLSTMLSGVADCVSIVIPGGEKAKTRAHLDRIYDFLTSEKICRADVILAIGGGVTTDLAGYAAATVLRGIRWVAVPTTLVGMVDAAIGGKTGINHPRGKNLIGAFHQPRLVWADTAYLSTLAEREMISGLGEILKYAGLIGRPVMDQVADFMETGDIFDVGRLTRLIIRCARHKAQLVAIDEYDRGQRQTLNLGHTFGHAIEVGAGYGRFRHGEAIILGLAAAVHLSRAVYPASRTSLEPYQKLIELSRGLIPRRKIDLNRARQAMFGDKKRYGGKSNFILLKKLGRPIIATDMAMAKVRAALKYGLDGFALAGEENG